MRAVQISLAMGALAMAAACGSSSSSPPANNPGPSDAAPFVLADGPVSSLNPSTMMPEAGPVMCGSMTCQPPMSMIPGFMLGACCRSDNSCGASFMFPGMPAPTGGAGCLSLSAGMPAPACPMTMMMGFALPGCCTTSGLCGIDLTMAGLGCNTGQDLASFGMGMGGPTDAGPPETCAAAAAAAEAGAGSEAGSVGADGH